MKILRRKKYEKASNQVKIQSCKKTMDFLCTNICKAVEDLKMKTNP